MAASSPDLIWGIVRNRSSFLIKRNGVQFTTEAHNLMNTNSFRNSGLANPKAVGIEFADSKAVMTRKTTKGSKPSQAVATIPLRKGPRRTNACIEAAVGKTYYRRDLTKQALARYTRINRTTKRANSGIVKKAKKPRGRRAQRDA